MALTVAKPADHENRRAIWLDLVVLATLLAAVFGVAQIASQWRHPMAQSEPLSLSVWAIPRYALLSFARGWIAYFFSLLFTVVIASWAFYDPAARRYIIPALDILQSIPVLTFLPGLEMALVALFPHSNTGLELACILSIFTGQVWNMTFSYYDSLCGVPADFRMLGKKYQFTWWDRLWRIELPFGAQGLLYNSMVSMAGGWFFLSVCEAFTLGDKSFQVPGVGSLMAQAQSVHNIPAQIYAMVAMAVIIVTVDRLVWWPLIQWAQKFKLDDFGGNRAEKTPFQKLLARSVSLQRMGEAWASLQRRLLPPPQPPTEATSLAPVGAPEAKPRKAGRVTYAVMLAAIVALLGWGGYGLGSLLFQVHLADWAEIAKCALITFGRVLASVFIGTVWALPVGIWIGLNPKLSGRLQPLIQFAASFPAPMLYPWLIALIVLCHIPFGWGSIALILFGTQWYILFNVAGAAAAIPNDIVCCAEILGLSGWRRWLKFLVPAVLPGLVTGWITAAGGAWNATIVAEYVQGDRLYEAVGLGSYLTRASNSGKLELIAAAAIVMAAAVVAINRTVWKPLQAMANERCRFIT